MEIIEFLSPKGAPPHFADEKIEAHGVSAKSSGPTPVSGGLRYIMCSETESTLQGGVSH